MLNETMKDEVQNVLMFRFKDLLNIYLSYVTHVCKNVKEFDRLILVLIFNHDVEHSFSVIINNHKSFEKCFKLIKNQFVKALRRHNLNLNLTLLTTSCYDDD